MVRRKKFDEGGSVADRVLDWATGKDKRSVMDKPTEDMRNPQYRKELEQKQGLETSAPELLLVGPARGAGKIKDVFRSPAKPASIPEIGKYTPEFAYEATKRKLAQTGRYTADQVEEFAKRDAERMKETAKSLFSKPQTPRERSIKRMQRFAEDAGNKAAPGIGLEVVRNIKENDGYKRGGKISKVSKRADGIAQRGKTKGRMV